jgi:hypothetical protein
MRLELSGSRKNQRYKFLIQEISNTDNPREEAIATPSFGIHNPRIEAGNGRR